MRPKFRILTFFLMFAFVSCTDIPVNNVEKMTDLQDEALTKVVKMGDKFDTESFLVKFETVPNDKQIDELKQLGIIDIEPVFISVKGKELQEQKFGLDRWYYVSISGSESIDEIVKSTATKSFVQVVEYNEFSEPVAQQAYAAEPLTKATESDASFNDPYLKDQWHYNNTGSGDISNKAAKGADVNVVDVWKNLCTGDPSIIVAVIDEGIKYTHPDLKANMWKNEKEIPDNGIDDDGNGFIDDVYGYNFASKDGKIEWAGSGDSGHATHCAGTIAAVNNNNLGVSGIAGGSGNNDGCRLMSCQIFYRGAGSYADIEARAIKYAADNGASVISCSFGTAAQISSDNAYAKGNSIMVDALHYFESNPNNDVLDGNIAIFAAGNENDPYAHYPGALYDIISVSAFGPDFLPTYYTNYGPGCNISAPGGEYYHTSKNNKSAVLSTLPSEIQSVGETGYQKADYGYMQGTSMACPHVSGVVALGLSYAHKQGKKFTSDEFKRMILSSVNDIDQKISSTSVKTYARYHSDLEMGPYYHKMGTGAIDAWRLMMKIDGIPTSTVKLDAKQWIDLSPYFGSASVSLTYLEVDVPQETINSLGLQKITAAASDSDKGIPSEGYAIIQFGRLYIHPTKIGSGKLTVKAVGGGDHLGGGDNAPGGFEITSEVSLVSRSFKSSNGGWL